MGSSRLASRAGWGTLCAGEIWTCILVSRCLVFGKFIVVMQKGTCAKCVVFVSCSYLYFWIDSLPKSVRLAFKKSMGERNLI